MTAHDPADPAAKTHPAHVEGVLHALAARQHGVVTREQLLEAGLTADRIDHRQRTGRLRRLHRGVYLVGPLIAPNTDCMAAVLACGPAAAASHRTAAMLWQLIPGRAKRELIDVVVLRGRVRVRPGVRVHHARGMRADEVTTLDGIPVTSVARTVLDMAGVVPARELEDLLALAFAGNLLSRRKILSLMKRHARRPGVPILRRVLDDGRSLAAMRSEAERRFLRLVTRAGLPQPRANVRVAGYEVDFFWADERLVVEVDGRAYHSSARQFENDRRRDAVLVASGLRVMRVTWRQIVEEPEALLVRLTRALLDPPRDGPGGPSAHSFRSSTTTAVP